MERLATPLRLPPAAIAALARPDVTAAELDALAGLLAVAVVMLAGVG